MSAPIWKLFIELKVIFPLLIVPNTDMSVSYECFVYCFNRFEVQLKFVVTGELLNLNRLVIVLVLSSIM